MENIIYVTGHKNPDSDSICAAIAYANLKNQLGDTSVVPARLGNISNETKFILDYFHAEEPKLIESAKDKKIILVDHNEKAQTIPELENGELLEIIDHHRIADIETANPIYFRNEPLGSTSTIVANMFFEKGLTPSTSIAGVLCGAIISDTLLLKSPTATPVDKEVLERLAKIANIELETFAKEMFKAGTSLEGRTADEIFNQDFKTFTLKEFKIGVAQITTMDLEGFKKRKPEFLDLMESKTKEEGYYVLVLLATDIIETSSEIIACGEGLDIINKAFNTTLVENSSYLPGVVSRKKQVIPPITKAIEELK